jgi:hypothetical protein
MDSFLFVSLLQVRLVTSYEVYSFSVVLGAEKGMT